MTWFASAVVMPLLGCHTLERPGARPGTATDTAADTDQPKSDSRDSNGDSGEAGGDTGETGDTGVGIAATEVCADGEFVLIQQGIDATDDGGVVRLCPGEYAEDVQVAGKSITVMGGGPLPGDVRWRPVAGPMVTVSAGGGLAVEWMAVASDGPETPVLFAEDADEVAFREVAFLDGNSWVVVYPTAYSPTELVVERNHVVGTLGIYYIFDDGGVVSARENLVYGALSIQTVGDVRATGDLDVEVEHNLLVGASLSVHTSGTATTDATFAYNTVVNAPGVSLGLSAGYSETTAPDCPDWAFRNNIFAESVASPQLWGAWWLGEGTLSAWDPDDEMPHTIDGNVAWALERDRLAAVTYFSWTDYYTWDPEWTATDTGVSATWKSAILFADPEFTAAEAGSYVPHPDGPASHAGAFAGSGGDWWRGVPWLMP